MKENVNNPIGAIGRAFVAVGIAGLSGVSAPTASAELIAAEDFGSTASGNLDGGGDGVGWGADWNTQTGNTEPQYATSPTLFASANVFSHSTDSYGTSPGPSARFGRPIDTADGGLADAAGLLDSNNNIGADGTTVYIGFAMQTVAPAQYHGFELYRDGENGGARSVKVSTDGVGGGANWNLASGNTSTEALVSAVNEATNYFVLKLAFGESDVDSASVFLNPTLNTAEGTADAFITGGNYAFDRLGFGNFSTGATLNFDDIRIGTTYADVVGPVPEPASVALVAGILSGFAIRRKRRD